MTYVLFAFFLIIVVGILFSGHYYVYFSIIKFFSIVDQTWKLWLAIILAFLPLSYIFSTLAAHYINNWFTKAWYYLSGLWLGLGVNLLLFFTLAWIVYALSVRFHYSINLRILGVLVISLAIIYSVYGIWNAYLPIIRNVTVKINNLPAEWQGKRIVQISDIHLGHVWGKAGLEKAVAMINSVSPELVVITGDLFDGMDGDFDFHLESLKKLQSPSGTYFITGNHETYFGVDRAYDLITKNTNIRILNDEVVYLNGLKLLGVSYPVRGINKDIVELIRRKLVEREKMPTILLYHDPASVSEIATTGVDLMLAGHTHDGQIFPIGFITKLVYGGYDFSLKKIGNFYINTTSGYGTWGPTMRTGNHPEIVVITLE